MANASKERRQHSRRQFLKSSGAALTTAALGAGGIGCSSILTGTGKAQISGSPNANGFDRAGIWYFHPSIFEYSLGPWQPYLPRNPDLVTLWKQTIDWFADHGLDYIVLHVAPYGGDANPGPIAADRVRFGWGYHYTLDFEKFPEARVFDVDFVKRNREIVRTVTDYGLAKGVDIFFHHYNFMMTMPFAEAHPELFRFEYLKKGNFIDLTKRDNPDFRINPHSHEKRLAFNVCWNKPLYQDFMVACFEEFLEQFPAAAGILVTPGERALCQCVKCIGEQPSAEKAKEMRYQDSPEKRKTIAHFCDIFSRTLTNAGKTPLIRSWISGLLDDPKKWAATLPRGPIYVMKYSVFDMTNIGVDPLSQPFLEAGHNLWLMKEYVGGENAGNVVMTVPSAFDKIAEECRNAGIKGVMGVDNGEHGFTFKSRRVQYLPELLFANSFGDRRLGDPEQVALDYYSDIFDDRSPEILEAVKSYSHLPYNISRTMWQRTEGFTWKFPYHFIGFASKPKQTGWPGTLAYDLDPPGWARREIVPLSRYVEFAANHSWDDEFRHTITGRGRDPILFLAGLTQEARKGLDALSALAPEIPPEQKPEMDLLVASATISFLTGEKWWRFFSARLFYAGAKGPNSKDKIKELAQITIEEYGKGLKATEEMVPIFEGFPNTLSDPSMTNIHLRMEIAKRHRELEYLKDDLAPALSKAALQN
jgi:hypothetical protein